MKTVKTGKTVKTDFVLVATGPGERNEDGAGCGRGECGRQVICDRPIVLNGCGPCSTGILQGDAAVGQ